MAAGNGSKNVSDFRSNYVLRMDKASSRIRTAILIIKCFVKNSIKEAEKQKNYNNECSPAV